MWLGRVWLMEKKGMWSEGRGGASEFNEEPLEGVGQRRDVIWT